MPSMLRHPDVHEDDVGPGAADRGDRLGPVGRLGRHLDAVRGQDHPETGAYEGLVVGDDGAQRWLARVHTVLHGIRAVTR